jgi:hypothetical protein
MTNVGNPFWARLDDGRCVRLRTVLETGGEMVGLVAEGNDDGKVEIQVAVRGPRAPRIRERFKTATRTWWRMLRGYRYIIFADYADYVEPASPSPAVSDSEPPDTIH